MFKIAYRHSDNDYRVATLSKSYLTTTGITMQSLKSKDNSNMSKLTKMNENAICFGRTDTP